MGAKADARAERVDMLILFAAECSRRLAALEAHIVSLEERLTDRGVFSGDERVMVDAGDADR